jgi:hypothetical protein
MLRNVAIASDNHGIHYSHDEHSTIPGYSLGEVGEIRYLNCQDVRQV